MQTPIPVIQQGLGPIGRTLLMAAARDPRLQVVGAVEIDKLAVGRDLAELVEGAPPNITVRPSLGQARADAGLGEAVVLHATGSYLEMVTPQLEEALQLGLHVVSTCEELSYPYVRHVELSARLNDAARHAGRTLVGTGINPGFLMDALPATLTGASHDIRSISVERVQNPTRRREPFQRKVGLGLARGEYDERAAGGGFGHVGLEESARLLAAALGWEIGAWDESLGPALPDADELDANQPVLGTIQRIEGETVDGRSLSLHFEANAGVEAEHDAITVDGTPPLKLRFEGGVFGDDATAASVLRCARVIPSAPRGLVTVLDLPLR